MANFILDASTINIFRNKIIKSGNLVDNDIVNRVIHATQQPYFITQDQLYKISSDTYCGIRRSIKTPLSFANLCKHISTLLNRGVKVSLLQKDPRGFKMQELDLPENFPVLKVAKLLNLNLAKLYCLEDFAQGIQHVTGMSFNNSIKSLKQLFFFRFAFQVTKYGLVCNNLNSKFNLFGKNSVVSVPPQTLFPNFQTRWWEIFLETPHNSENMLNLYIWNGVYYNQLFSATSQKFRWELLALVRQRRENFIELIQNHAKISREDAKLILEFYFYNIKKIETSERSLMLFALNLGFVIYF